MQSDILLATEKFVNESESFVTIQSAANKLEISWASARAYLLKLAAEGKIDSEELQPRGLIFHRKVKPQTVVAELNA